MARTGLPPAENEALGPNGRPQVLAQLAKDISDLIRSARSPLEAKSCPPRPCAWRAAPREPAEEEAPAEQETPTFLEVADAADAGAVSLDTVNSSDDVAREGRTQVQERRCPDCGNSSLFDANFCRHCGRRLAASKEDQFSFSAAPPVPTRSRRPEMGQLLADLESREAALRAKVQQLTDEKSLRERRLEDELEELRRTNLRLEEELRQKAVVPPVRPADVTFGDASHVRMLAPASESSGAALSQDLRDDLQQQLQEIREEVMRCARTLEEQESIPPDEVQDIRQQLQAMSEEVHQTSQTLPAPESELDEVRRQLDSLQRQVSSALNAALARPIGPLPAPVAQNGSYGRTSLLGQGFGPALEAPRAWPRLRPPVRVTRSSDLTGALEQLETLRQSLCASPMPMHAAGLAPEVAALHGRLTAIRAEVARVIQESQSCESSAEPMLQTQLRVLLSELSDVRCAAAAVAQAAAGGFTPQHSAMPWQRWQAEPVTEVPQAVFSERPSGGRSNGRVAADIPEVPQTAPAAAAPELRATGPLVSPMYVCQHLAPDLTFGPEAMRDGSFSQGHSRHGQGAVPLSRPSSAASGSRSGEAPGGFASRAPEEPVDRAPQHALRRPSRSKLVSGEG